MFKSLWVYHQKVLRKGNLIIQRSLHKFKSKQVPLDNTLTGRFIQYLSSQNSYQEVPKHVQNLTISNTTTNNNNYINNNTINALSKSDKKWSLEIGSMPPQQIINYLNYYMKLIPNEITNSDFYKSAMQQLHKYLDSLSLFEKVAFIFYVGLQKRTTNAQKTIKTCLQKITQDDSERLNLDELLIVCNSCFKSSSRVNNRPILDKVVKTISNNLFILHDAPAFITFVKTLRHNRCQTEELLCTVTSTIFFNKTYTNYNFAALCHILILYADYNYYDDSIFKLFSEKCIEQLESSPITDAKDHIANNNNIRVKDLKRFLWTLATIGYKLPQNVLEEVIEPRIRAHLAQNNYAKHPDVLVETFLYLCLLEYKPLELMAQYLKPDLVREVKKTRSSGAIRLNLLLICLKFENWDFYKQIGIKEDPFKFQINTSLANREELSRIYGALKLISADLNVDKIEYEFQIPHVNIVGITGYRKNIYKVFFVEVLDNVTAFRNRTDLANGKMQFKLRVLRNMDPALIIISANDIKDMDEYELQEYLKNEINFTC